jgi:copper resistance protein D
VSFKKEEEKMGDFAMAVSYWVHLTATSVWIGGIIFILIVAIPSSKQTLGADAGKLMSEISRRFTPLANYSIILLVMTGIVLAGVNKQFPDMLFFSSWTSISKLNISSFSE